MIINVEFEVRITHFYSHVGINILITGFLYHLTISRVSSSALSTTNRTLIVVLEDCKRIENELSRCTGYYFAVLWRRRLTGRVLGNEFACIGGWLCEWLKLQKIN